MTEPVAIGTKVVQGVVVRDDPAREPCYEIVHLHHEVPDMGGTSVESRRERLHRETNNELQSLEVAAICVADFPDAPWELRLELARQCWDEARHTAMCDQRLKAIGGRRGQFPIANLDWSVVAMIDSLAGRMAVQHRTFEAGSMEIAQGKIPFWREADEESAEMFEAIEADEVQHVRFANEWINRLTASEPRTALQIASAVGYLRRVVAATAVIEPHDIATDVAGRQSLGFSSGEIAAVQRQERELRNGPMRSLASERHE
jgi:uncharacterized ferritin-like protein (DUF455 family)